MNHQKIAVNTSGQGSDKLFNFRPVFFAAIFLCLGIVFAYALYFYDISPWWAMTLLPILAAPLFLCETKQNIHKVILAVSLLAVAFVTGGVSFGRTIEDFSDARMYYGVYSVVGTVSEKTEYEYSVKVVLQDLHIGENEEKGKLVAYLPSSFGKNVSICDKLFLRGKVTTDTDCFKEYGFRAEDIADGTKFFMEEAEEYTLAGRSNTIFLRIRAVVEEKLFASMDQTSASVTLAVLTGNTSLIERGLLNNVRRGGIAHIFAVSGLHVGALYAFCLWLTEKTRLKSLPKPFRLLLMSVLLLFYAGICGFSSSVLRAMTLCLVSYAAKLIGTETDFLQTTGLAAIFILLREPTELFSIGFQLSFAACLGIALFARPLRLAFESAAKFIKTCMTKWLHLNERARPNPQRGTDAPPLSIWGRIERAAISFVSVSLAAQIATAPLQLYTFGYVSVWGLLLNNIFVPFISGIFSVLLLFVFVATILPSSWSAVLLYLPSVLWNAVLLLFEGMDFSTFALTGIHISVGSALCYYAGWVFLTDKWNMSRRIKYALASVCFFAFLATMYALNV